MCCTSTTKEKAATRQKFKSIDVFMLPKFSRNIPKNKERKALKSAKSNKKIMINRQMSALQVKNVILREFAKDHPHLNNFMALECEANNLLKYASYELNGTNLAERKGTGSLYFCEVTSAERVGNLI